MPAAGRRNMEYQKVYRHSLEEAVDRGEKGLFRESHEQNVACKNAIEAAIRENFDGMHLDKRCLGPVMEEYGPERVEWVLANTLQQNSYDGRFSRSNKEWAEAVTLPESGAAGRGLRWQFAVGSHPAVLDGFVSMVRREQEAAKTSPEKAGRKPSIKEQLSAPPVPGNRTMERKNDREVR